jgi:AraC-like DNA-binding protein
LRIAKWAGRRTSEPRIDKALEMIGSKDHSITDVAFAVGFNELSTFQKAFKHWTNLTPSDFKRLARPS